MAIPSNPNFKFTDAQATQFEEAIRGTMQMAFPNTVQDRVTFIWKSLATHDKTNSAGRPFDFNESASAVEEQRDAQVDCAVEFVEKASIGTSMGEFDNPRVVITMFGNDFETVQTADYMTIGGNRYIINFVEPPIGFFPFDVYRIHGTALDES